MRRRRKLWGCKKKATRSYNCLW